MLVAIAVTTRDGVYDVLDTFDLGDDDDVQRSRKRFKVRSNASLAYIILSCAVACAVCAGLYLVGDPTGEFYIVFNTTVI